MEKLLLLFYIIHGLMVPVTYGGSIDFKAKKPILCAFHGDKVGSANPDTPLTDPKTIPPECEVITFSNCNFDDISKIKCTGTLKQLVDLKRPFILEVFQPYVVWSKLLKPDGNIAHAKALADFAKANGAIGVTIGGISMYADVKPDVNVANNFVQYLKQLKSNPDFVVGIFLNPKKTILTDPCVFNYEASNEFVDYYTINTYRFNINDKGCDNTKFNGLTPTTSTNGLIGLDTIIGWAKTTKMSMDKVYLVVDLVASNPDSDFACGCSAYSEVCTGKTDTSHWCVPTTKDLYDKAKFILGQKFGVIAYWIEFDDPINACGCCAFIGLKNIAAGYNGGSQIQCAKIDTNSNTKPGP